MDRLKQTLDKIPFSLLAILYIAYLGYDIYNFYQDPGESLYLQKKATAQEVKNEIDGLKKKKEEAERFLQSLQVKRTEIRSLAVKLSDMKATLSEDFEISSFLKLMETEGKRVGLRITDLKPNDELKQEYFFEQNFDVSFKGVFAQLVVFLERLSKSQKIIRIDEFEIHPIRGDSGAGQFVELAGALRVKVYRYNRSKADEIAKASQSDAGSPAMMQTLPGTPGAPGSPANLNSTPQGQPPAKGGT